MSTVVVTVILMALAVVVNTIVTGALRKQRNIKGPSENPAVTHDTVIGPQLRRVLRPARWLLCAECSKASLLSGANSDA